MTNKTDGFLATTNGDGSLIFIGDLPNKKDDPADCASDSYNNRFENGHITSIQRSKDFDIMLDNFVKKIPPKGTIVDVGCGIGFQVKHFSSLGFRAYGIDISEEIIRIANENFRGLNFICGNLLNFPISSGLKMHGIYEYLALMYSYKPIIAEFIAKAFELLETNGVVQASFEKSEEGFNNSGWYLVPYKNLPKDKDNKILSLCSMVYLSFFTEEEIRQLFETNGFKIVDFRCYREPTTTVREIMTVLAKKEKPNFLKSFFG